MAEDGMTRREALDSIHTHRDWVADFISLAAFMLRDRMRRHDLSKLEDPEFSLFRKYTPILRGKKYGTLEYEEVLEKMKPMLQHHFKNNRHHPEFFKDGIEGMNLIDLVEMVCDWLAAAKRDPSGDIKKSVEIGKERFGIGDQLAKIIYNTVVELTEDED